MGKVETYRRGLGAFISSDKGQRFFNFAYSIGAAVVIWGALFKILHLPGGNALLSIGMGTEVLMFVLTAFDRPPREYKWEDVFPALKEKEDKENAVSATDAASAAPVIVGAVTTTTSANSEKNSYRHVPADAPVEDRMAAAAENYLHQMEDIASQMQQLQATTTALNEASTVLLQSYKAITDNSAGISESSQGYVNQMQTLYQNIGGLNTIYELQLRSVSSQIDSIDRVNRGIKDIRDMYEKSANQSARYCEETERMARYMQQLNSIYERMIAAMTVNMYRPVIPPADININAATEANRTAGAPETPSNNA